MQIDELAIFGEFETDQQRSAITDCTQARFGNAAKKAQRSSQPETYHFADGILCSEHDLHSKRRRLQECAGKGKHAAILVVSA